MRFYFTAKEAKGVLKALRFKMDKREQNVESVSDEGEISGVKMFYF